MKLFSALCCVTAALACAPALHAETLFSTTAVPQNLTVADPSPVELGVKLCVTRPGVVRAVRFYKGQQNVGPHSARVWNISEVGTYPGDTVEIPATAPPGWVEAPLVYAFRPLVGSTFIASYHTQSGYYSADNGYFAGRTLKPGALRSYPDGGDGPNGVYKYGAPKQLPADTYNSTNYWVDVDFVPDAATTRTASLLDVCDRPAVPVANDTAAVELGVRFTAVVDGQLGIQIYRQSKWPGPFYYMRLWSANGEVLANGTVPVSQNPGRGWLTALYWDAPLTVRAGQTYVVSYHSPEGQYPVTTGAFPRGADPAVLTTQAAAGVFAYGPAGTFPTQSWQDANYFINVQLAPTSPPAAAASVKPL